MNNTLITIRFKNKSDVLYLICKECQVEYVREYLDKRFSEYPEDFGVIMEEIEDRFSCYFVDGVDVYL